MPDQPYRFVENPNAPEIFLHHLHRVEVIGPNTRFVPVTLRFTTGGLIGEPPITLILPNEEVGPALALTWQSMPSGIIVPAVGQLMRRMLTVH